MAEVTQADRALRIHLPQVDLVFRVFQLRQPLYECLSARQTATADSAAEVPDAVEGALGDDEEREDERVEAAGVDGYECEISGVISRASACAVLVS